MRFLIYYLWISSGHLFFVGAGSSSQNLQCSFRCFFVFFSFFPILLYLWRADRFSLIFTKYFLLYKGTYCVNVKKCLHERKRQPYERVTSSYVIWIYIILSSSWNINGIGYDLATKVLFCNNIFHSPQTFFVTSLHIFI